MEDVLQDQLSKGEIERAPASTSYPIHYLPFRLIVQKEKLHIVYDASQGSPSLNDALHAGSYLSLLV